MKGKRISKDGSTRYPVPAKRPAAEPWPSFTHGTSDDGRAFMVTDGSSVRRLPNGTSFYLTPAGGKTWM